MVFHLPNRFTSGHLPNLFTSSRPMNINFLCLRQRNTAYSLPVGKHVYIGTAFRQKWRYCDGSTACTLQMLRSLAVISVMTPGRQWVPRGCDVPRFISWLQHYIKCLLAYLTSSLIFPVSLYLLTFLLPTSLRIGPFRFQDGCCKRRLNLALFLC